MATLDEYGREVLDQTPISIPFNFERPEPVHMRLRRMVEQYHREANPEFESVDDANDFEIPEDPSSYDSTWTEPDLEPVEPVPPAYQALSDAEVEAARALILKMRAEQQNAGADGGVSSPPEGPAEPAKPDSQTS